MRSGNPFVIGLVAEEVNRLVAEANESGGKVSVAECAARLRARYPAIEILHDRLAQELRLAAEAQGVSVEIVQAGPETS